MDPVISKEEFGEAMNLRGQSRGDGMKSYTRYLDKEKGEGSTEKIEKVFEELGHPIDYSEMKTMNYYPIGLWSLTLLVIKRMFDFEEEDFKKMGEFQLQTSLLTKLFMKYFVSIERAAKELPKIWRQYFTVGEFETVEVDSENKRILLRLKGFAYNPYACKVIMGVFRKAIKMITKKEAEITETKCPFKEDEYHEFLIRW